MKKLSFSHKMSMMIFLMIIFAMGSRAQAEEAAAYLSNWKGKLDNCFELTRNNQPLQWGSDNFNQWFYVDDVIKAKDDGTNCGSASLTITENTKGTESSALLTWKTGGGKLKEFKNSFAKPDSGFFGPFVQVLSSLLRTSTDIAVSSTGKGWIDDCGLGEKQYLVASPDIIYIPSSCFSGEKKVKFSLCGGNDSLELNLKDGTGYWKLENSGMKGGSCYQLSIQGRKKDIEIQAVASKGDISEADEENLRLEAYRHINTP
ncbi:MAG: hypothetical protein BWK78_05755 [Thiotrichaceae bacterium IS1]|nr:MAG: hypothetical protein BWK78_05755 [Thiotrichaceae bacterium IS1]